MSEDLVSQVRRAYELFEGPRSILSAETAGAFETLVPAGAELVVPPIYPDAERVYRGLEGWRRWWRLADEVWEDFTFEVERLLDGDRHVLALVRAVGRARQSGTTVSVPVAHVWSFRSGRLTRLEVFLDRARGFEAAGVLPSDPRVSER